MDKSFEKELNIFKERYISPKNKTLQSQQNPEFTIYSPVLRYETTPSPLLDMKLSNLEDKKANSKAVANCIRAITDKLAYLEKENQALRRQMIGGNQQVQQDKENLSRRMEEDQQALENAKRKIIDYENEIKGYRNKLLVLEDQNRQLASENDRILQESNVLKKDLEYETSKTQKLENTFSKIKSEVKENEEWSSNIESENSQLKKELEESKALNSQLQKEISLFQGSDKQKKTFFESQKVKELEYKNKFLQDLADTQQKEIEQLRKEIEILRSTVTQLENTKDLLMEQNSQNEQYLKDITEIHEHRKEKKKPGESHNHLKKSAHSHSHHSKKQANTRSLEKEIEEIDRRYQSLMNSPKFSKGDLNQLSFSKDKAALNSYKPFN
ncbi:unnamed protein product [Blepharisma stoltei]|uniref:G protein gamma domain-containing protein n=1 Tax=Blepharisma stoltei TaxID=1481888 RepID=A0AAU9J6V6_9CILI|nr:unnamed protein product [Blepharisma stoltei]